MPSPQSLRLLFIPHLHALQVFNICKVHHFRRVLRSRPAVIFPEGHVQHPVQLVLDRPVFSRDAQKVFRLRVFQTGDEVNGLQ